MICDELFDQCLEFRSFFHEEPIWRIEKDQLHHGRVLWYRVEDVPGNNGRSVHYPKCLDVGPQSRYRRAVPLEKERAGCTAAQAFQPHASGPREAVENDGIRNQWHQDIK